MACGIGPIVVVVGLSIFDQLVAWFVREALVLLVWVAAWWWHFCLSAKLSPLAINAIDVPSCVVQRLCLAVLW